MMDARRNGLVLLALLLLTQTTISAQTDSMGKDVPVDSVSVATSDSLQTKRSFFKKFLDYFNDANKEKKNKKFDFSVIGGPHYSSDTKFGLGLVAAGLYRTDRNDSILPPSNVSLYGDVSTVGFYLLGVRGNHLFPQEKYRLNYNLYFYSFSSLYWGRGYDNGANRIACTAHTFLILLDSRMCCAKLSMFCQKLHTEIQPGGLALLCDLRLS